MEANPLVRHRADHRKLETPAVGVGGDEWPETHVDLDVRAAPVVYPERYACFAVPVERLPTSLREAVARLRETTAGSFALRLYAEDRGEGR
jgi:glutathione S-transferase